MRALVLGGGGLAGIGWEWGIIAGLAARGVDLAAAEVVIGTSAGSAASTCRSDTGRSWPGPVARWPRGCGR
jgi:predicted acylesterase/phospholipase RssA